MTDQPSLVGRAALVRGGDVVESTGGQWRRLMVVAGVSPGTGRNVELRGNNGEYWELDRDKRLRFWQVGGHQVRVARVERGFGPLKGGGKLYGSHLRCTCGVDSRMNEAPSLVGKEMMKHHLEDVLVARGKEGIETPTV